MNITLPCVVWENKCTGTVSAHHTRALGIFSKIGKQFHGIGTQGNGPQQESISDSHPYLRYSIDVLFICTVSMYFTYSQTGLSMTRLFSSSNEPHVPDLAYQGRSVWLFQASMTLVVQMSPWPWPGLQERNFSFPGSTFGFPVIAVSICGSTASKRDPRCIGIVSTFSWHRHPFCREDPVGELVSL